MELLILFLYLFIPPMKIPIYHIMFIFSLFFLALNLKKIFSFKQKKIVYVNILYIILLFSYSLIIIKLNGKKISNLNNSIVTFIEVPITALAISYYLKMKERKFENLVLACIKVSFFQSVIALFTFIFPNIQMFIIENFLFTKKTEEQKLIILQYLAPKRLYGLSNGLTYSTPIFQGVISSIALYYSKIQKKYLLYFILILFSGVVNARVGGIAFLISVVIVFIKNFNRISLFQKFKNIFGIIMLIIFTIIILMNFEKNSTVIWLNDSIEEINKLLQGKKIGTFEILFGQDFLRFPSGIDLYFGTGETVFGKENGSDIGYVNDIWFGGIIYTIILWIFFIHNYISLYFSKIKSDFSLKIMATIFFITSVVSHIKGTFYAPSSFWTFIVLICIFNMVENREGE